MKIKHKIFLIIFVISVYLIGILTGFLSSCCFYNANADTVQLSSFDSFDEMENVDNNYNDFLTLVHTIEYNSNQYYNGERYYRSPRLESGYYLMYFRDFVVKPYTHFELSLNFGNLYANTISVYNDTYNGQFILVSFPQLNNITDSQMIFYSKDFGSIQDNNSFIIELYRVSNFSNVYDFAYDFGYDSGYDLGSTTGYDTGYTLGYDTGYDFGYEQGTTHGYSQKGLFHNIIDSLSSIFEVRIGGEYGLSIGGICLIGIVILSFFALIKMLR